MEGNQELAVEDIQVQVGTLELLKDILVEEDNPELVGIRELDLGNLEIVLELVDIPGLVDNQWIEDTVVRYLVESQYRAVVVVDRTDWDTFVRRSV